MLNFLIYRQKTEEHIFFKTSYRRACAIQYSKGQSTISVQSTISTVKAKVKKISIVPHRYLIINLFKKKDIVQLEKIKNLSMVTIIFFSNRQNNRLSNGKFIRL